MVPSKPDPASKAGLDLDSVAALIHMDRRYLLQHREDRVDVAYPNCWGLFGGACEPGESAADALHRELLEELSLEVTGYTPLMTCTYDLWFENRRTRKAFFAIELSQAQANTLILQEGQGMAWLDIEEILARVDHFVPFDLGVIALHNRGLARAGVLGQGDPLGSD
jgi:8-oxo-dGTP pyrophosphatase MutT (NUDIX family)